MKSKSGDPAPATRTKSLKPKAHTRDSDEILKVRESIHRNELVVIVGTGISLALTDGKFPELSWKGLIANGFVYGEKTGLITPTQVQSWKAQLESSDIDDLLGAAEFVGRKLGAPNGDLYARWLENAFKQLRASNRSVVDALRAVVNAKVPICTLNYDHLLESVTDLPALTLQTPNKVTSWMRRENNGIVHLHGSWEIPSTCILGIRDYESTIGNDLRDLIQRSLGTFKRLLFVGCGDTFADPNFSALIKWLRETMRASAPEHYALVDNAQLADRRAAPSWRGFVAPIGYGENHNDLPVFLTTIFESTLGAKSTVKSRRKPKNDGATGLESLLQRYRAFIVKDCGQMTIEGVRADMDIGQRRFDLERLFVPLQVVPSRPDISLTDPDAEQKLRTWEEEMKKPKDFGKVFGKTKKLALLALPGGGKTLLLKRIAVAYADDKRLLSTDDALPELQLTPVMIRCREWREHIRKPILTLLQSIPDITGQADLVGIREALLPVFKEGKALLLIDGLDEIHVDADRATFVEHLESFLDDYPKVRLVVTSREAGFTLVAPCLSRFCARWRVAPLQPPSIKLLCDNWRQLMSGDSADALREMNDVYEHLMQNTSLQRLAENPLLLTMLLVVKHGAGRLPPDRVSLYSRAVEVLLDTWNIKGHDPLNLKESVPQLACVAFELMKAGKQTATEHELLALLEEARERVPQIQRYAKDSPFDFLKRVELRSSLLLEAGHQIESGKTVPFYQFRHLTFQEYLAAVAVVEGHYFEYSRTDTVLTPLAKWLVAEEWKEVVPMAAVLARKQSEPLMFELLVRGQEIRSQMENDSGVEGDTAMMNKLPAPVGRLLQCLAEEAEATPETTTNALQLISFFARGCRTDNDWRAISKGPYGAEFLRHSIDLFSNLKWNARSRSILQTCSYIADLRFGQKLSQNGIVNEELRQLLDGPNEADVIRGLFTIGGRALSAFNHITHGEVTGTVMTLVEQRISNSSSSVATAAIWAWALALYESEIQNFPTVNALNQILSIWLNTPYEQLKTVAATALWTRLGLRREMWTPILTEKDIEIIKREVDHAAPYHVAAALVVAFHALTVWTDDELKTLFERHLNAMAVGRVDQFEAMQKQLKLNPTEKSKRTRRK